GHLDVVFTGIQTDLEELALFVGQNKRRRFKVCTGKHYRLECNGFVNPPVEIRATVHLLFEETLKLLLEAGTFVDVTVFFRHVLSPFYQLLADDSRLKEKTSYWMAP